METPDNVRAFVHLTQKAPETLEGFLTALIKRANDLSILIGVYKETPEIMGAEGRLKKAIADKSAPRAMTEIENLRGLYKHHGIKPNKSESGYYNMLRLLDEIGEFVLTSFI